MKFSILVPAYKPQFLVECIESILAQTYLDFELIIVNDASPHNLDSIVNQFDDKRLRYYTNETNYGAVEMVKNWNHCLEYATGEYVINMGDDDKLTPTCLENYALLIEQHPDIDVFHTRTEVIDEGTKVINIQEMRPERESVYSMIFHYLRGRWQWMGDWLFKVTTLREIGGYYYTPCAWGADSITSFLMASKHGVVNVNTIGFQYRNNSQTVSNRLEYAIPKVKGLYITSLWLETFLKVMPKDSLDIIYRKAILNEMSWRLEQLKIDTLQKGLNESPMQVRKCMKESGSMGLGKAAIFVVWLHVMLDISISSFSKCIKFLKHI